MNCHSAMVDVVEFFDDTVEKTVRWFNSTTLPTGSNDGLLSLREDAFDGIQELFNGVPSHGWKKRVFLFLNSNVFTLTIIPGLCILASMLILSITLFVWTDNHQRRSKFKGFLLAVFLSPVGALNIYIGRAWRSGIYFLLTFFIVSLGFYGSSFPNHSEDYLYAIAEVLVVFSMLLSFLWAVSILRSVFLVMQVNSELFMDARASRYGKRPLASPRAPTSRQVRQADKQERIDRRDAIRQSRRERIAVEQMQRVESPSLVPNTSMLEKPQ